MKNNLLKKTGIWMLSIAMLSSGTAAALGSEVQTGQEVVDENEDHAAEEIKNTSEEQKEETGAQEKEEQSSDQAESEQTVESESQEYVPAQETETLQEVVPDDAEPVYEEQPEAPAEDSIPETLSSDDIGTEYGGDTVYSEPESPADTYTEQPYSSDEDIYYEDFSSPEDGASQNQEVPVPQQTEGAELPAPQQSYEEEVPVPQQTQDEELPMPQQINDAEQQEPGSTLTDDSQQGLPLPADSQTAEQLPLPETTAQENTARELSDADLVYAEPEKETIPESLLQENGDTANAEGAAEATDTGTADENLSAAVNDPVSEDDVFPGVQVEWEDDDNNDDVRPEQLFVRLRRNDGELLGDYIELNGANGWQYKSEESYPVKDEEGNAITYEWEWYLGGYIPAEDGTQTLVTSRLELGNQDQSGIVGYNSVAGHNEENVTDTYRKYTHLLAMETQKLTLGFDKNKSSDAVLPESVTLTLPNGETVTLNAENNWTASVKVPRFVSGEAYEDSDRYNWVQGNVTGWKLNKMVIDDDPDERDGVIITLTDLWTTEKSKEEVEVPVPSHNVRVQYWTGNESIAPAFVGLYEEGQPYNISSPNITGYRVSKSTVTGTASSDRVINVYYTPNTYRVKVYYRYLDGSQAAAPTTVDVKTGQNFAIDSPAFDGYDVNKGTVSGQMKGRDLTYVVYYTYSGNATEEPVINPEPETSQAAGAAAQTAQAAEEAQTGAPETVQTVGENRNGEGRETEIMIPATTTMEDYETPLGLGDVGKNAGECFE